MPYGVFPVPKRRDVSKESDTALALRIRTRFQRAELDTELAYGADPPAAPS